MQQKQYQQWGFLFIYKPKLWNFFLGNRTKSAWGFLVVAAAALVKLKNSCFNDWELKIYPYSSYQKVLEREHILKFIALGRQDGRIPESARNDNLKDILLHLIFLKEINQ